MVGDYDFRLKVKIIVINHGFNFKPKIVVSDYGGVCFFYLILNITFFELNAE